LFTDNNQIGYESLEFCTNEWTRPITTEKPETVLVPGTRNPETEARNPEPGNRKPETGNHIQMSQPTSKQALAITS